MIGKFGVGCCCDPFCLWRNPSPWTNYTFIDWYNGHVGYKRYKLGADEKYSVVDNRYLDEGMTEQYHFDNWMELLEYDSAIEPSDSDYFAVTREQIETDLYSVQEAFASRHYDEVPLYFVYLFVIDHSVWTRQPRQYLIPVHEDMTLGNDFASLFGQAIAKSKMPGISGTMTRPTYYDFFAMIMSVTTSDYDKKLLLTWDDRCIAELCSRIVSTKQGLFSDAVCKVHVGHCTYNRVGTHNKTWLPRYGKRPYYNGWPDGRIKGVECTYSLGVHFDPSCSGIAFTPIVDPYSGTTSFDGPRIPADKLYLFDDFCRPSGNDIVEIYDYYAEGVFLESVQASEQGHGPVSDVITGVIPASSVCGEAHYRLVIDSHNGFRVAGNLILSFVTNDENNDKVLSDAEAEARAEEIFSELDRIAQPVVDSYPTPPDVDYYATRVNCEGLVCKKHTLYECYSDYLLNTGPTAGNECGSLKITSNNLVASAIQCQYATATNRRWLKCTNCRVVECRSPVLPGIDDTVAAHMRIPTASNGKVLTNAGYIEVRSAFCNAQSCSAYVDEMKTT
ncbi:MAG: hypothetical protein PHQ75_00630 [Thermoguttaceae bacterium]|nr:hypothetical protein [Thermoguttaceae bacterium]